MSFTCEIKQSSSDNKLQFEILGNPEYGFEKTIVNAIRRTLLSSIDTYAFRTDYDNPDIIIETNNTSLHNEFILDRVGLIPLYMDPINSPINNPLKYLFVLNFKHDNSNPISIITAANFNIYELDKNIMNSSDYENGLINTINKDNYNLKKPLPDDLKKEIFRPFQDKYYSIIIETKSTNSDENIQELILYGSPSVSIAKEDARWQAVSCATYSYKIDESLLKQIIQDKILMDNIIDIDQFKKEFEISNGQRYFHRDNHGEPYWYNFVIEGQHFLNNKELFIKANEIIIQSLNDFKGELDKLLLDEDTPIHITFNKNDAKNNVINMLIELQYVIEDKKIFYGFDDTLGSIIQAHISRYMIDDKSVLNCCGYKRTHPLENKILFTMSMNNTDSSIDEQTKKKSVIEVFDNCCDELINIFNTIISSADTI